MSFQIQFSLRKLFSTTVQHFCLLVLVGVETNEYGSRQLQTLSAVGNHIRQISD